VPTLPDKNWKSKSSGRTATIPWCPSSSLSACSSLSNKSAYHNSPEQRHHSELFETKTRSTSVQTTSVQISAGQCRSVQTTSVQISADHISADHISADHISADQCRPVHSSKNATHVCVVQANPGPHQCRSHQCRPHQSDKDTVHISADHISADQCRSVHSSKNATHVCVVQADPGLPVLPQQHVGHTPLHPAPLLHKTAPQLPPPHNHRNNLRARFMFAQHQAIDVTG